ncbi:MAG TPA: hypothetical protein VM285_11860 [Polyangia bacterium]|nr:hypothetical protein [Polyangia bacterium]
MTYNFDPDRWFEIESAAIDARRASGEIDEATHRAELEALADRYEEHLRRIEMRHDYREGPR